MKNESLKVFSGYVLICLIWGSTWMAIRIGLDSLTPIFSAGLRFSSAAIFVFLMMKFRKITLQKDSHSVKLYLILGVFSFIIPYGLVYWGEQFIPSGLTSIIFAVMPFFVILFSKIFIPESAVGRDQILGSVIGFGGIVIIFSEDLIMDVSGYLLGMLAVLLSASIQGWIAVHLKKHGGQLNPLAMNFVPLVIAGISMTVFGLVFEDRAKWIFNADAIGSILYLGFFGTSIAFTTYYWLLKKINVVLLSLSTLITPIIAVLIGWLILDEKLSLRELFGSVLVLIGILFANFTKVKNYFTTRKIFAA
ncbi:MAG: EamA family transporter [Bacteroidetes bacterium]|nr:EamA family transporter [Bacteroidota bacterium]